MVCPQCGFTCNCFWFHGLECENEHIKFHEKIAREQEHWYTTYTPWDLPRKRNIKRCSICEEEIGVSDHECKSIDKSKDVLDFIIDLFRKK